MFSFLFKKKINSLVLIEFLVNDAFSTAEDLTRRIEEGAGRESPVWMMEAVALENFLNYYSIYSHYQDALRSHLMRSYITLMTMTLKNRSGCPEGSRMDKVSILRFHDYKKVFETSAVGHDGLVARVYPVFCEGVALIDCDENHQMFKQHVFDKIKRNFKGFKNFRLSYQ